MFQYTPPEYSRDSGVIRKDWEPDFKVSVQVQGNVVVLKANRDGLVTLAKHMLTLAQKDVPFGCHFHYDAGEVLEDGSTNLVIDLSPL